MPKFGAYFASGDTSAFTKNPRIVRFKILGKSHLHAVTLQAATRDDAFEQLQVLTMSVATAHSIPDNLCPLSMIAGDVLLEAGGGPMHIRKPDGGWITREVD